MAWDAIVVVVVVVDDIDGPFWIVSLSKFGENKTLLFWRRLKLGF